MKKLLLAIYLTLMVSTLNGETVKKENVKWIKLKDYYDTDTENIEKGIVYQEVKGKNYKCGEIINGEKEGKWIYWYENGQKKSEGNYVKGKEEGKWIDWYENGNKGSEVNFKNGNPEGKWIEWYENGQKKYEVTCKDDKFINLTYWKKNGERVDILTTTSTGEKIIRLVNTIDEDMNDDEIESMGYLFLYIMSDTKNVTIYQEVKGKDYKCGELKDGEREGKWIDWYENGQKKSEGNYVKGKEEGKYISWYENGQKEKEVTYKDGEEIKGTYWNEDGELIGRITKNSAGQRIIKLSSNDAEILPDVIDGIVYREINGKDYKCGELKNGVKEGKWIEWYENGQKREEGNYLNGNPEGKYISWYENGKKGSEIKYKDGEKIKGIYWNWNGEIIGRITKNSAGKRIIKLSGDDEEILQDVRDGIVYREIKGKDYKCGELEDGAKEGKWIEWYENGRKREEGNYLNRSLEGKYISWYENGQKEKERNYLNGEREGKWIDWYENGQKKEERNYVNGECEGNWIKWYENGKKESEVTYKDGEKIKGIYWNEKGKIVGRITKNSAGQRIIKLSGDDEEILQDVRDGIVYIEIKGKDYKCGELKDGEREGNWIEYYENGKKKSEGNYVKGEGQGNWIEYYENGQKKEEGNYLNGEREGNWIEWYENGHKKLEGNYVKGKEEGKYIYWYENGQKKEEGNYLNGEREGNWIEWYENGHKKLEGNYVKGKGEGKYIYWYENGNKESEGNYENGEGEGKWIDYYENGHKKLEGNFKKGKGEGNWKSWYENGNKESEIIAKDGKKVEGTYWNEKGEVIGRITTNSKGKTTVKLLEYDKKIMKNVGNGVVYQEIKGKDYKCGELKDGKEEGKWIEWNENGEKKSEVTYKDGEEIKK